MEGHCSTGQSPQWAAVPMEEEEGGGEEEEEEEEEDVRRCDISDEITICVTLKLTEYCFVIGLMPCGAEGVLAGTAEANGSRRIAGSPSRTCTC